MLYKARVFLSPRRTARVSLPTSVSPGMSRKLLMTSRATAKQPTAIDAYTHNNVTCCVTAYIVPHVATNPKNTNTKSSPSPMYPYGLGPPVYSHPAPMQAAPTTTNHNDVASAMSRPVNAATPNAINAARLTTCGDTRPEPTSRKGPTRFSSVPRTPSE